MRIHNRQTKTSVYCNNKKLVDGQRIVPSTAHNNVQTKTSKQKISNNRVVTKGNINHAPRQGSHQGGKHQLETSSFPFPAKRTLA